MRIGRQQIRVAEEHVRVVGQERTIARTQTDQAEAVVEFLGNKFTSLELYDWMSEVLEGVYSFFLQQATAVAKLAEHQLAFERQQVPPALILADYWEPPRDGLQADATTDGTPDRRGLTGSARLLQDIYRLDQYAFETDRRKEHLTKTLSLARLAPVEFQRLRETGVIRFDTPLELFDRDFPGHYLRLIKRVRKPVVIALVPPTQDVNVTLSSTGLSRVVVGGTLFQTVSARQDPATVAFSLGGAAGERLDAEPHPEMLRPFEGMGVGTSCELRLPKPSNHFDYSTLADVLLTVEYTALHSVDYREQVVQALGDTTSADRPFSFRHQFADVWYDLNYPDQTAEPMLVRFRTGPEDFPPNLNNLKIQHATLYFARRDNTSFEVPATHLHFKEQRTGGTVGGAATSVDGIISTRYGNAGSWNSMIGKVPFGEWELALPNSVEIRNRFMAEDVKDVILVITYTGSSPAWPA